MEQYQLGEWDLSELAKNPKSPAFQKQIKDLEDQAKKFEKIKSKLNPKMSSKQFKTILQVIGTLSSGNDPKAGLTRPNRTTNLSGLLSAVSKPFHI